LSRQRVLIVGCGYVGARVAARLRESGDQVFAVTRSAERARDFTDRGWTPIVTDVMDPAALTEAPPMDAMLYAVGYDRAAGVPKRDVYVDGFARVLQAMHDRCGRVVAISSTSVYGQNNGEIVDESTPADRASDSGRICLDAERALWSWRDRQSPATAAIVLRLAGIYGPGRMLARAESLLSGQPFSGKPEAWLNLVHGDDAASLALAAVNRGVDRKVYIGVDSEPARRRDFYGHLATLLGAPLPTFSGIIEPGGRGSESGINKRVINPGTRRELGVGLRFPTYREGLADAVAAARPSHRA
jgi:nucleoside-diphosphate-sugar epimerase